MAFEQLKAEIAMLVQQMEREPDDVHELHARIRQKLAELKAMGQPLPDDLAALEKRLDSEERMPARGGAASTAGRQPAPTPSPRQAAGRGRRRAAAKKKASPAKKAKRPAARKSAAAGRRAPAKQARKGAAKARRSPARKAKRSARGRR